MYSLEALRRLNEEAIKRHQAEQERHLRALVQELVRQELARATISDDDAYGDAGC